MINQRKKIAVIGSTGSIGRQTLDVIRNFKDHFDVLGLACGNNKSIFLEQVREFNPEFVSYDFTGNDELVSQKISLEDMASHPDVDLVVIATTGKAGLMPSLSAIKAGKQVMLANKEILAMAGAIITHTAEEYGARLLPIDSEHSAIWQCLQGEKPPIHKLWLTASGGPFYNLKEEQLHHVTVKQALAHPTWQMGKKVTIDSATLFNKGMEVIEAYWLFSIPFEQCEIVIHRQSIVHSMIEFVDGSIKAQLSPPDMHLPIQYALFYPDRMQNDHIMHMNINHIRSLTFDHVDYNDYPCLKLAIEAGKQGGTYPAVLCAADEIAIELFLNERIPFTQIAHIIEETLNKHQPVMTPSLEEILFIDAWARNTALEMSKKG